MSSISVTGQAVTLDVRQSFLPAWSGRWGATMQGPDRLAGPDQSAAGGGAVAILADTPLDTLERPQQEVSDFSQAVLTWFRQNSGRLLLLVIVAICAALASKLAAAALRKALDRSNVPSASIFINIVRALIWIFAAATVLQPVFGINPSTVVAALGVSGLALSFGLKDTIANIVGGFGLMASKVIQPGDIITISGTTGTVKDITWRHTIVADRAGNRMLIPNSILNTTSLEKIPEVGEAANTVPFTLRGDADMTLAAQSIARTVAAATEGMTMAGNPPIVQFRGFTPYGITGQVVMFAKRGVAAADMQDAATRALAGKDYLVQNAGLETAAPAAGGGASKGGTE